MCSLVSDKRLGAFAEPTHLRHRTVWNHDRHCGFAALDGRFGIDDRNDNIRAQPLHCPHQKWSDEFSTARKTPSSFVREHVRHLIQRLTSHISVSARCPTALLRLNILVTV